MNCRSLSVRTTNNDTERIGAEAIFMINFVRLLSLRAQSVLEETDKLQRSKDQVFCHDALIMHRCLRLSKKVPGAFLPTTEVAGFLRCLLCAGKRLDGDR